MNPIEHYPEEQKKLDQIRKNLAAERQEWLDAVDAYLKEQETSGVSRKEIYGRYFRKYYRNFLDNPLAESMSKEERYNYLKELIYKREILPEKEKNMGARKAA